MIGTVPYFILIFEGFLLMLRSLAAAFLVALTPLTTQAVVFMDFGRPPLPVVTFEENFFKLDNTPLTFSGGARAQSLFAGQGWGFTDQAANGEYWEYPIPPATPVPLALMGQYNATTPPGPYDPPTPAPGPALAQDKYQNVVSFTPPGLRPRMGGLLYQPGIPVPTSYFDGVTSFLFSQAVNTFSAVVLDAGITKNDDNGGPVWFAFYDQLGALLQLIEWSKAKDGPILFWSTTENIRGLQIYHQDPYGLEFESITFGVWAATPDTVALLMGGMLPLVYALRRRRVVGRRHLNFDRAG